MSEAEKENEEVKRYQPDDSTSITSHSAEGAAAAGPPAQAPEPTGDEPYLHRLNANKLLPPCPGDRRDYQIDWLGPDDPDMPLNWSVKKKSVVLLISAMTACVTAFGSAVVSTSSESVMKQFHVGLSVAELNTSLYVLGFAMGPILWGPMSEQTGRKLPQLIGMFGLMVFAFAGATAKDFQTIVLTRFFSGILGSSSFATSPAVPADMYGSEFRGKAMSIVSLTICAGPMLAPVVGGYIVNSYLGWRWTFYILGIFASLVFTIVVLFLEESYPPKVLSARAKKIREETGNWSISAPLEALELDTKNLIERTLSKPIKMLAVEPILLLVSLYHGFIYGILYLCLSAVPLIFTDYGWPGGNVYLPYLAMFIGTLIVIFCNIFYFEVLYNKRLKSSGSKVLPEERLPLMMCAGVMFTIGIFLLTWSGAYKVFWFVPCLGCSFIGFGLIGIFLAAFNYIIDSYLMLAASALAANAFTRAAMACAFPLFATQMFRNLGTQWAGTLLGCLAVLLAPVPFCFYFFGKTIRQKSVYAFDLEALEVKLTRHSTHGSSFH
nr:Flu1 [Starmerella bombicola]